MTQKKNDPKKQPVWRVANILVVLSNGDVVPMDISKVTIIDKTTGKPILKDQ